MADINLLQNQLNDTTHVATRRTKTVVWVGLIILLILVGASVGLYLLTKKINTETVGLANTNNQLQTQLTDQKAGLGDAAAYQAQLANLKILLNNHIAFSPLMEELAKYTYQRAVYTNVDIGQDSGQVHLQGVVDSYAGLGNLMLGLSTSSNFKNVKLLSLNPSSGTVPGYSFAVDMQVLPGIFIKPQ